MRRTPECSFVGGEWDRLALGQSTAHVFIDILTGRERCKSESLPVPDQTMVADWLDRRLEAQGNMRRDVRVENSDETGVQPLRPK